MQPPALPCVDTGPHGSSAVIMPCSTSHLSTCASTKQIPGPPKLDRGVARSRTWGQMVQGLQPLYRIEPGLPRVDYWGLGGDWRAWGQHLKNRQQERGNDHSPCTEVPATARSILGHGGKMGREDPETDNCPSSLRTSTTFLVSTHPDQNLKKLQTLIGGLRRC